MTKKKTATKTKPAKKTKKPVTTKAGLNAKQRTAVIVKRITDGEATL